MTNLRDFLSAHDPVPEPPEPASAADAQRALAAAKIADEPPVVPHRTSRRLNVLAGVAAAAVACVVVGGVVFSYLQGSVSPESTAASGHDEVASASEKPDPAPFSRPEFDSSSVPTEAALPTGPASGVVVEKDTPASGTTARGTSSNTLPLSGATGRWLLADASHDGVFIALDTGVTVTGTVTSASDEELRLTFDGLCGPLHVTWTQRPGGVFGAALAQRSDPSCTDAQQQTTNAIIDILGADTFTISHTQQRLIMNGNTSSLVFARP